MSERPVSRWGHPGPILQVGDTQQNNNNGRLNWSRAPAPKAAGCADSDLGMICMFQAGSSGRGKGGGIAAEMGQLVSSNATASPFSNLKYISFKYTFARHGAWTHGAFSGRSDGTCQRHALAPAASGGRARLRRKRSLARSLAETFVCTYASSQQSKGFAGAGEAEPQPFGVRGRSWGIVLY